MGANNIGRPRVPRTARIAVIGAGAAGLTASHTLQKLGDAHVTVHEKEDMAGGRVLTDHSFGVPVELGAVFATDSHTVTLELAKELGVETYSWDLQTAVLERRVRPHRSRLAPVFDLPRAASADKAAAHLLTGGHVARRPRSLCLSSGSAAS